MRLLGVEVSRIDLALSAPVGTSAGTHKVRPVVVVRLDCDLGQGWGESGALAEGTVVDPPAAAVWSALVRAGARRLLAASSGLDGELPPAAEVAGLYGSTAVARAVAATVEMAVLDAELTAAGIGLGSRLGAGAVPVPAGGLVGIPEDRRVESLLDGVDAVAERGLRRVRLKIEPGWDAAPVAAVRRRHPDLPLQADANGAYRWPGTGAEAAGNLVALDDYGLVCIEQPLPPADLGAHAELADRLATPICLDESLTTPSRVVDAIRSGACEVACLKPSRLGGLLAARRAQEACRTAGVPAFVGGFFETGLGRSANASLAGLAGFTLPGDLTDPGGYLVENPWEYPPLHRGMVGPAGWPGVGGEVDTALLARRRGAVERFEAPTRGTHPTPPPETST